MPRVYPTIAERFEQSVDKNGPIPAHCPELGPCHIWIGFISRTNRYGQFTMRLEGRTRSTSCLTHRVAFFLKHGRWPYPSALHHCDNRACVRWEHIYEGTQFSNVADMIARNPYGRGAFQWKKAITHCPIGHLYDEANTVYQRNGTSRKCRQCMNARKRVSAEHVTSRHTTRLQLQVLPMSSEQPHFPQCVRFRPEDLALIRKAAERADERVSPWIRAAALERAGFVLDKHSTLSELELVPAGEEVRCVRFRTGAMDRVQRAAKREKLRLAEWIRAVAVAAAAK